ncbi:MAG: hypothetical protein RIS86_1518, partial [Planctomycetota bacterium]
RAADRNEAPGPSARRLDAIPRAWTTAPDASDGMHRWRTVWTVRSGLPFRAFAGEAREAQEARDGGSGVRTASGALEVGELAGKPILLPLRPQALPLLADVAFWSVVSWFATALPRSVRRRRRERLGRCGDCGRELDPRLAERPDACPGCDAPLAPDPLGRVRSPEMHFQNSYVWLVFVSSLDIMLTWRILDRGGTEVNPVAALVIDAWGMHGAITFKFAVMTGVIVMCEVLARMRLSAGRFLATAAVAISAAPVAWSLLLLAIHRFAPGVFAG